jgi:serine protease AprX
MIETRGRLLVCSLAATAFLIGCEVQEPGVPEAEVRRAQLAMARESPSTEPGMNQVLTAVFANGQLIATGASDLPATAYGASPPSYSKHPPVTPPAAKQRIDRLLVDRISNAEKAGRLDTPVTVVVNFRNDLRIPRFPSLKTAEDRRSPGNQSVAREARQLAAQLQHSRAPEHARHSLELAARHRATVKQTSWLINALTAEVPLGEIAALSTNPEVEFIEEDAKGVPPPANAISDARALMNTDGYFNMGLNQGYIAMLDTGVRRTHVLLTNTDLYLDCVNGTQDYCETGNNLNPDDDHWNHGTKSANVLSGNDAYGDWLRGVTAITVDSFKVHDSSGLVVSAAVRGFEAALAWGDPVILANIQDTGAENGTIATAADAAFDAGAVVVAAAGNYGSGAGSVRSPARAHKALGVGAIEVTTQALEDLSGRGPASDNRTKPDLTAPARLYTATNANDTGYTWAYDGTSCAAPNATGAAALVRNFVAQYNPVVPPGQIYAFLVMSGKDGGGSYDNDRGAGLVSLPSGTANFGSVSLTAGSYADVYLLVSSPATILDAAIWWPEGTSLHNDVDLFVYDPNGGLGQGSMSNDSVFEKVRSSAYAYGYWRMRINGYSVTGTQTVYWAFSQHQ